MSVSPDELEEARARLLELHPEGFEERDGDLAAYTDAAGEARLRAAFGRVAGESVAPGWEDGWRAFHRPVAVGPLWVGPPWVAPDEGRIGVVIDPGRAFGTGAHPTTRLCLELLLAYRGGSVLDVGCGSGVLAIAAAKLGFAPVTALDHDDAALDATRRNAAANDVELAVGGADVLAEGLPPADIVLANIDLAAAEALAGRLRARVLITSGYLSSERPRPAGFAHRERRVCGSWAADRWERE